MRRMVLVLSAGLALVAAAPAWAQGCDDNYRNSLGDAAALRGLGMNAALAADTHSLYGSARFDTVDYPTLQARVVNVNKAMIAFQNARTIALQLQQLQGELQQQLQHKANRTNAAVSDMNAVIAAQCAGGH